MKTLYFDINRTLTFEYACKAGGRPFVERVCGGPGGWPGLSRPILC